MINAVIDISHHNGAALDFAQAKGDGILGVVHKASHGVSGRDQMYATNRAKATVAGMLWGAYHFADGSDPGAQASNFLAAVGDRTGVLLVLDFEPNPTGASMSLAGARAFVLAIRHATGSWPGLYSGGYLRQLLGGQSDAVLANCWLWMARYGPEPAIPAGWPFWTMWQYTDGINGDSPHSVAGIGHCDRDRFNGDEVQLRRLWGVA